MSIKITADSSCDLSNELISKYNIGIIPLYIIKEKQSFRDGIDIMPNDIFEYVGNGGDICTTSAININDYSEFFAKLSLSYKSVIHISLGSDVSTCYRNAKLAATEFENVYVIDSKLLSTAQGSLAIYASEMAASGMPVQNICEKLNELVPKIECSFLLDRLDFMHKGGRCSSVELLGANLLRLKPCIEMSNGTMGVAKKYRGNLEKCIEEYTKDRFSNRTDLDTYRLIITNSFSDTLKEREIINMVKKTIGKYVDFKEIFETKAGCTISCHCGPQTLGFFMLKK